MSPMQHLPMPRNCSRTNRAKIMPSNKRNMKKLYITMTGLMIGVSSILAQPSPVQKVAKSVFTLTTFNKEGGIIAATQGVFIDNKGTAISTFKPFIGAVKATVVDATGKSMEVDAIMGADELYDVAKFRVDSKTVAAPIANKESAAGSKVWLVPYSIKKPAYQEEEISSVEKFNTSYNYYIFSNSAPDNAVGCPFVNKAGQVIALMHNNGSVTAIDANFANQLKVTGLSSLDAALRESGIRTALPDKETDAITMMTLNKGQKTGDEYMKYANEFIGKFPTSAFGYKEKAFLLANKQQYAEADQLMQESIKKSTAKDEAHSNYADIIYQKVIYQGDSIYPAWNVDKAIAESQAAYAIKAEPLYKHQEAQSLYLKKDYQKAYDLFMGLTKTPMNSGGEKIELGKPSFVLGKNPEKSDYAVADNTNISRVHAVITTRNGRYYVMDQNSTNGTFINGRIIKAGQETEILPGDCLMLANEEFIFNE